MAISDEEKVDLLWKKFIYGVSKTETPGAKSPSNETRPSPIVALGNQIWINAKDIPSTPPAASTAAVQVKTKDGEGSTALTMITDSSDAKAWRAFDSDNVTPLENWIPFSLGAGYALKLWIGDPAVANPAPTMLFLDGSGNNDEYFFDYKAGILYFIGSNLPVSSSATLYIEGYRYIGPLDVSIFDSGGGGGGCGNEVKLCAPTDGDLTDPALTGTQLGVTFNKGVAVSLTVDDTVTDAIDGLNEIVGLLMPDPPPSFPNQQQLTFTSVGNNPKLCDGAANNAGAGNTLNSGDSVIRIPANAGTFASNIITGSGSGKEGLIHGRANDSDSSIALGSINFDDTDNTGTNLNLTVNDNYWHPSQTPGFWQAFDCQLNIGIAPDFSNLAGVNEIQLDHSIGGQTKCLIVIDDLISLPNIDLTTASISQAGQILKYSSGVAHYGIGQNLLFQNIGLMDIAGETYCGDAFFELRVNDATSRGTAVNPFNPLSKDYDAFGVSVPLSRWTNLTYLNPVTVTLDNDDCAKLFQASIKITNVNGSQSVPFSAGAFAYNILYLAGRPAVVLEDYIPVLDIPGKTQDGVRVGIDSDVDEPTKFANVNDAWNSATPCSNYHATIIAGQLAHDTTDYRYYLPSSNTNLLNPNYDTPGRSGTQYVTFKFEANGVSNFDILVDGTYDGCWVRLDGITNGDGTGTANHYSSTSWWNMFQAAESSGIPGDNTASFPTTANGNNGCARSDTVMTGLSGRYNCTFGNANSSDAAATGKIYIRFKLTSGQIINDLVFLSSTSPGRQ